MARGKSGLPRPPTRGQSRSAAVNKGQQGTRRRRSDSAKARPQYAPAPGMRDLGARDAAKPANRSTPGGLRGQQYKRGSGSGPDIGRFASDVSRNFGRGVAEAGRQISDYAKRSGGGRKDPLADQNLGRSVNENKGKSWINR